MKRVTGLGGVFFKAKNPAALYAWYREHLGIDSSPEGGAMWGDADHPDNSVLNVWALFPQETKYFGPGQQSFMLNFRVDDLDALLVALRAEGVEIDPKTEPSDYGKFAWIIDPEGNRVELWEPPKNSD